MDYPELLKLMRFLDEVEEQHLDSAFECGQMDDDEYNENLALLEQIRNIVKEKARK